MKTNRLFFSCLGLIMGLAVMLMPSAAIAQNNDANNAVAAALGGVMLLVFFAFFAAFYVYNALALQTIAKKTNTENGWMAWIPIANLVLAVTIAKKPIWWFILFLIPIVNIVIGILVFMGIAEARNKPSWWGVMVIVPVMNLVMPGYLAWSD